MSVQTFHEARAKRMLTQVPVWWFEATAKTAAGGKGWPVDGDELAKHRAKSFSKSPHSPRFPSPTFARVRGGK